MRVHQASSVNGYLDSLGGQFPVGTHSTLAAEGQDTRTAILHATPIVFAPSGPNFPQARELPVPKLAALAGTTFSPGGQTACGDHTSRAAGGPDFPQATVAPAPMEAAPAGTAFTLGGHGGTGTPCSCAAEGRTPARANAGAAPNGDAPARAQAPLGGQTTSALHRTCATEGKTSRSPMPIGAQGGSAAAPGSLSGHTASGAQCDGAAEGMTSPQANDTSSPKDGTPAGTQAGRSHHLHGTQRAVAAAPYFPGGHATGDHQSAAAAGDPSSLRAIADTAPMPGPSAGSMTSRGQYEPGAHRAHATADELPGGQILRDAQSARAAGASRKGSTR